MRPSRREGRLYHDTGGRAVALIFLSLQLCAQFVMQKIYP
jgi:hypothetical protein